MGAQNISYPATRLDDIFDKLKKAERYYDDLANTINDKIDEIFREYM